ncbi:LLM class flavin-dependent oxidoreductase [Pseudomonas aeruginosa]|nr:LLM class flavin-dependent oxidoreductase [Pseudomonas aeruginosa]
MSIELRGGVRASAVIGDSAFARQAARFLPDTRSRAVSAFDIQQKARLEEADGLDGALFTVSAAWPDPWLVAGWALAAAPRLRATVAHRPGSAQPTVAARALATLDGLSNGRAGVHLVIGSSDADVRRDGDFADKDERYRRAVEYLEVFTRALESREPFDYHGEFYRLEDAGSGFLPIQRPRPPLSVGGSSAQAQRLAVRFADVYAGHFASPTQTAELKRRLNEEAAEQGRRLKFWKHFQVILGDSPAAALDIAEHYRQAAFELLLARPLDELAASPQVARDGERDRLARLEPEALREWVANTVQRSFAGVLLASVVGVIFGPTGLVISSFSLFIEPIAADLDWDRGQSALPVTLLGLAVALSSPLKGWLVDRWGARALVLPLTAALALCLASLALARSGWQLYLLFALLGLLTPGNIPYARILGGWFERRRGAAYGILGLGFGVGGPLALYLGSACIDAFGWRATFLVYGLLEGLLALPLLYALFRERPGDLPQARRPPADALPGATPGQAWRSADFWLIVGNLILGVFAVTGVMVHGVPLLQERGLSREVATEVLAALWVGMIVSQPALGYLLDRYDTPRIALPFALLAALGLLLLLLGGPPALLWGAVFLIGLGAGGETGTTQYFVSRYFGLRHFSVIYGSIQPFTFAIAISLGAWLLGYFYDRAGSYAGSTLVLLGAFGVAAGLLVMLGRYRYAIDGEARSHGRD